jgi:MFS family permease
VLSALLGVLAVLTVLYQFGLDPVMDAMQSSALGVRVVMAILVLAPLGLCLGMFMPLGLRVVGQTGSLGEQYVAWSWAVNGFFSVIGSVLTTILAMELGFRFVQFVALALYALAVVAFVRLRRAILDRPRVDPNDEGDDLDEQVEATVLV